MAPHEVPELEALVPPVVGGSMLLTSSRVGTDMSDPTQLLTQLLASLNVSTGDALGVAYGFDPTESVLDVLVLSVLGRSGLDVLEAYLSVFVDRSTVGEVASCSWINHEDAWLIVEWDSEAMAFRPDRESMLGLWAVGPNATQQVIGYIDSLASAVSRLPQSDVHRRPVMARSMQRLSARVGGE